MENAEGRPEPSAPVEVKAPAGLDDDHGQAVEAVDIGGVTFRVGDRVRLDTEHFRRRGLYVARIAHVQGDVYQVRVVDDLAGSPRLKFNILFNDDGRPLVFKLSHDPE
jgi:hypothetical protein